jgi:hypothetical protein
MVWTPRWTAPAYDRCLLFALLYPVSAIFVLWAATGRVGPVETALGLPFAVPLWHRAATVAALAATALTFWRGSRSSGNRAIAWFVLAFLFAVGAAVGFALVDARAFTVAGAIALAFAGAVEVEFAGAFAVAGVIAGSASLAAGLSGKAAFAIAAAVVVADIVLEYYARQRGRQGWFLTLMTLVLLGACFAMADRLASLPGWGAAGPLLLFLGLLTLIAAMVDWVSLGTTRALMRVQINANGLAPYILAILGAVLACVFAALLAAAMFAATDLFDVVAEHSGGRPVLALRPLLDSVRADPFSPANWWIYAILAQAVFPGLANLLVAACSIVRGVPYLVAAFFNRA